MILHENKEAFRDAIRAASDHFDIREIFVEKDYWVTLILKNLSLSEFLNKIVFKGGTSLSKGYKLIQRFSEDIDLAVLDSSAYSGNQLKEFIKSVESTITGNFKEIHIDGITKKWSKYRKVAFEYPKLFDDYTGSGLSDKIFLELNSFANPIPFEFIEVNSIIADFFYEKGFLYRREKYRMKSFKLNILIPQKTLTEKVVALIRHSFGKNNIESIKERSRHFYDIHFLSNDPLCYDYLKTDEFVNDLKNLVQEDQQKFGEPEGWSDRTLNESPLITNLDEIWEQIRTSYNSDVKLLVHGQFPDDKIVLDSFRKLITKLI